VLGNRPTVKKKRRGERRKKEGELREE